MKSFDLLTFAWLPVIVSASLYGESNLNHTCILRTGSSESFKMQFVLTSL